MYEILTSLAAVIVVLGVMITVHEFGHFAAAKYFKVRVEQFAIGFGKRLIGFRRGETEYRINLLPLGGYVKMSGENPMDAKTGDPGEFTSHPRWQRFIIAAAGPAMNILLAVVLLTGVYTVRYDRPAYLDNPAVVGWVLENSPAEQAGIQPGDRIVRVDDVQNPTWEDLLSRMVLGAEHPLDVAVQRDNQVMQKTIAPAELGKGEEFRNPGLLPDEPNVVTEIQPDLPAALAGIQKGDVIVAIDGQATRSMSAVVRYVQQSAGKPVEVDLVRNGVEQKVTVTPRTVTDDGGNQVYRLGVLLGTRSDTQVGSSLPFGQALAKSVEHNKKNSLLILELVKRMFKGQVSMKQVEGPIRIAQVSGQAARQDGWLPLLTLMAVISLNLGIFNLFPFPILDGGVILLLAIEGIRRRDISLKVKEKIYQAAFVLLILFAVAVIYNDLVKTLPGVMQ